MRILFTCVPGIGHVNDLLPVVRAAEAAGHRVAVATAPTFGARFVDADVEMLPSGFDWSQTDRESLPQFHHRRGPALPAFAEVAAMGMVDDLLAHAKRFEPDLIVWDTMEFGGWVAGELLGVPQAAVASGMGTPRTIVRLLAGTQLAALAEKYGLAPDPELRRMFGHPYLHRKPRILDLPYAEPMAGEYRFRPAMFDEPAPPALDWLDPTDERPLVHVSLGTTFIDSPAAHTVNATVIAALADEPVRLVVTIGAHADPASYGLVPANTVLVSYVDHKALLPHCAMFLGNGSFSSALVAIANGLPLCLLPMGADQPGLSMHLANLGLGVNLANVYRPPVPSLDADALSAADVRSAVRTVLENLDYANAVGYVRDEFRRLPTVSSAIDHLERLAGR